MPSIWGVRVVMTWVWTWTVGLTGTVSRVLSVVGEKGRVSYCMSGSSEQRGEEEGRSSLTDLGGVGADALGEGHEGDGGLHLGVTLDGGGGGEGANGHGEESDERGLHFDCWGLMIIITEK